MSENCIWKKELDSGCSAAYILQLFTAENSNSEAIYYLYMLLTVIGAKVLSCRNSDKAKRSSNLFRMLRAVGPVCCSWARTACCNYSLIHAA